MRVNKRANRPLEVVNRRVVLLGFSGAIGALAACSSGGGTTQAPSTTPTVTSAQAAPLVLQDAWTVPTTVGTIETLAWRPGAASFAAGDSSGAVLLVSSTGVVQSTQRSSVGFVSGLAWTSDGKTLLAIGTAGKLWAWPAADGWPTDVALPPSRFLAVAIAPNGETLAVTQGQESAWIMGKTANEHATLSISGETTALAFSPDGNLLAGGNRLGSVFVWKAPSGDVRWSNTGGSGKDMNALAWSPDGTQLAAGYEDGTVVVYAASTGKQLATLTIGRPVNAVSWSPGGAYLAVTSLAFNIAIWHVQSQVVATGVTVGFDVNDVVWSPAGDLLVCGSDDRQLHAWSVSPAQGPNLPWVNAPGYMAR